MVEFTKWFATVSVCAALAGLAINLAIAGPCLLQIRAVTGSSITNIALIFPIMSVGRLLGSVPTGLCSCPRWRGLVLGSLIFAAALVQVAVPWLPHLVLMLLSFLVLGFADGFLDAESNNIIKGIWPGKDESFLVAARTSMIVGFAIGPFLSIPFVETPSQPLLPPPPPPACTHVNTGLRDMYKRRCEVEQKPEDCTTFQDLQKQYILCTGMSGKVSVLGALSGLSKLQTLYMITSIILAVLALCVGLSVWLAREQIARVEQDPNFEPQSKLGITFPPKYYIFACVLLSLIAFCSNSINLSYIDFIATFVVIFLKKTARDGAYVTVLCCACAVIGSVVPIFLVRHTRATYLVGACLAVSTVSSILLAIGAHLLVITWIGSALLGLSSFAIYALMFVLADELMGLTNRLSALLVGVSAVGEIVMSFTAGRLFEPNPMNLMYILLAAFLCSDCCYLCVWYLSSRKSKTWAGDYNTVYDSVLEKENGSLLH